MNPGGEVRLVAMSREQMLRVVDSVRNDELTMSDRFPNQLAAAFENGITEEEAKAAASCCSLAEDWGRDDPPSRRADEKLRNTFSQELAR